MRDLTDKAWESLQTGETVFTEGVHTFNGCVVTITECNDPYGYTTTTGTHATKSARYSGTIKFPSGKVKAFTNKRGGAIARDTGFKVTDEQGYFSEQGDNYVLPYLR